MLGVLWYEPGIAYDIIMFAHAHCITVYRLQIKQYYNFFPSMDINYFKKLLPLLLMLNLLLLLFQLVQSLLLIL